MAGGNAGGGVIDGGPVDIEIGYPPFARQARLNAIAERLRSENWDVTGSLVGTTMAVEPTGSQRADDIEADDVAVQDDDDEVG